MMAADGHGKILYCHSVQEPKCKKAEGENCFEQSILIQPVIFAPRSHWMDAFMEGQTRDVEITKNVILDQDQVQTIYFDLRSDQRQIISVI